MNGVLGLLAFATGALALVIDPLSGLTSGGLASGGGLEPDLSSLGVAGGLLGSSGEAESLPVELSNVLPIRALSPSDTAYPVHSFAPHSGGYFHSKFSISTIPSAAPTVSVESSTSIESVSASATSPSSLPSLSSSSASSTQPPSSLTSSLTGAASVSTLSTGSSQILSSSSTPADPVIPSSTTISSLSVPSLTSTSLPASPSSGTAIPVTSTTSTPGSCVWEAESSIEPEEVTTVRISRTVTIKHTRTAPLPVTSDISSSAAPSIPVTITPTSTLVSTVSVVPIPVESSQVAQPLVPGPSVIASQNTTITSTLARTRTAYVDLAGPSSSPVAPIDNPATSSAVDSPVLSSTLPLATGTGSPSSEPSAPSQPSSTGFAPGYGAGANNGSSWSGNGSGPGPLPLQYEGVANVVAGPSHGITCLVAVLFVLAPLLNF